MLSQVHLLGEGEGDAVDRLVAGYLLHSVRGDADCDDAGHEEPDDHDEGKVRGPSNAEIFVLVALNLRGGFVVLLHFLFLS